jgi:hypothetical protein
LPLFEDSINKDHLQVLRGWLNTVQDVKSVDVAGMSEEDDAWLLSQLMDRILTSPLDDVLKSGRLGDPPDASSAYDGRRKILLDSKDKKRQGWAVIPGEWQVSLSYLRNVGFDKAPLVIDKVDMGLLDKYARGSGALTDAQRTEINKVLSKYGSEVKPSAKAPAPPAVIFDPMKSVYGPSPVFAGTLRGGGVVDADLAAARARVTDIYGPAPALPQGTQGPNEAELVAFVHRRYELMNARDTRKLVLGVSQDNFGDPSEARAQKAMEKFLAMPTLPGPPGSNNYYVPLDIRMLAGQAYLVDPTGEFKMTLATTIRGSEEARKALALTTYLGTTLAGPHWEATVTGSSFKERVGQLARDMEQAGSRTFAEHKDMHVEAKRLGQHENPPKDVRDFYERADKEIKVGMNNNNAPTTIAEYYRMAKGLSEKAELAKLDKRDDLMRDILLGKVDLVRAEKIATGRDDRDRKKEREQEEKGRKAAHV